MPTSIDQRIAVIKARTRGTAEPNAPPTTAAARPPVNMTPAVQPKPATRAPAAARRVPPRRPSDWRPLTAALVGFVAGVVFWHFIGFWSFVHETVLRGGAPRTEQVAEVRPPEPLEAVEASGEAGDEICTLHRLDRPTGRTTLQPCRDLSALTAAAARRWAAGETALRQPAVAGWSTAVTGVAGTSPER